MCDVVDSKLRTVLLAEGIDDILLASLERFACEGSNELSDEQLAKLGPHWYKYMTGVIGKTNASVQECKRVHVDASDDVGVGVGKEDASSVIDDDDSDVENGIVDLTAPNDNTDENNNVALSISSATKKRRLVSRAAVRWTSEEDSVVKTMAARGCTLAELAWQLPDRTLTAVAQRLLLLRQKGFLRHHLTTNSAPHAVAASFWTAAEDATIKAMCERGCSAAEITARLACRERSAVESRMLVLRRRHGIGRSHRCARCSLVLANCQALRRHRERCTVQP